MKSTLLLSVTTAVAAVLFQAPVAHAAQAVAIAGQVTSKAEGAMEGVVVTATRTDRSSR